MPQDQSATRMMNSLQSSLSQDSQQFIQSAPTSPPQPQVPQPQASQPQAAPPISITDSAQVVPSTPQHQPPEPTAEEISDQQKLALFETVVQEVENAQAADQTPPVVSVSKERAEASTAIAAPQELPGGMQYETEPVPEISPELESYLQQAQEMPEKLPQEIVKVAAQFHQESVASGAQQPVKVLPVTKVQAEEGKKKNTSFSLRWLVEFSNKLSRLFAGKSIYRTD